MNVGQLIKRITPPLLFDVFSSSESGPNTTRNLWEGIYLNYRDVPIAGDGFDSSEWIRMTRSRTETALVFSEQSGTIPTAVTGEHMLLPLLASVGSRQSGGKVDILDFGGGMGITFVHLITSLVDSHAVRYHVVEREGICEAGRRLFEGDKRIQFHSEIPNELSNLDIVYISSAIQYVEDYAVLIETLCALDAKYFFFVKLSAGDVPTYVTAQQNVRGNMLPYWVLNVGEVIQIMATCGYSLIYKSALEQEYDQSNFPVEYRFFRTCNLLFSK